MSTRTTDSRDAARALVGRPQTRPQPRRQPTLRRDPVAVVLAAGAIVALAVALVGSLFAQHKDPLPMISGPATGPTTITEGPGGRVALVRWELRLDPQNIGLTHGWSNGRFKGADVLVPHVANAEPVSGPLAPRNYDGSVAWYRTSFDVPQRGLYGIDFGSVDQLATVWLDGRELGSHLGEYLPFEYRALMRPGPHELVVRADFRDPAAQTAQGLHRTWFNFGGINREVSVRPIGDADIMAPTLNTRLHDGHATVSVTMEVHNYGPTAVITPTATLSRPGQSMSLTFTPQSVAQGATGDYEAQATIDDPALWSTATPNLYDLSLTADQGTYEAQVGLRQLTWSHGLLYLNGHRLVLHGASIQEEWPGAGDALTPADQNALVRDLRRIGANATRSQHPLDPGLLEKLDAAGIAVWQGVGPVDPAGDWTSDTTALRRAAERRVRISVIQGQLHPSIIAWSLANEVAGNGHPGGEALYVERSAAWIHTHDSDRLVAVDVWGEHPPSVAGPLYSGLTAVGDTNYAGWYDDAPASPASIAAYIRARVDQLQQVFAGKVLLISEFGAEANNENPNPELGSYAYQAQLLAEHIRIYESDPLLSGMLVWALQDFAVDPTFAGGSINVIDPGIHLVKGIDQKGLFNYYGSPKPAMAVVRKAYKALGPY